MTLVVLVDLLLLQVGVRVFFSQFMPGKIQPTTIHGDGAGSGTAPYLPRRPSKPPLGLPAQPTTNIVEQP